MKKFNYKKWVVENKYGKPINEISIEGARVLKENLEEKDSRASLHERIEKHIK